MSQPTPHKKEETLQLEHYWCGFCYQSFYHPSNGTPRSPERCPYCGSTSEYEELATLEVKIIKTWDSGRN